jgi:hypothetical protein
VQTMQMARPRMGLYSGTFGNSPGIGLGLIEEKGGGGMTPGDSEGEEMLGLLSIEGINQLGLKAPTQMAPGLYLEESGAVANGLMSPREMSSVPFYFVACTFAQNGKHNNPNFHSPQCQCQGQSN